jgi:hypothetical protein
MAADGASVSVPEAAMVAGALARLRLIADEADGPWRGAALTAFDVIKASHDEAYLIIGTLAATNPIVQGPPPNNHQYCEWCVTVQIFRRDDQNREPQHQPGCVHVRANQWFGSDG